MSSSPSGIPTFQFPPRTIVVQIVGAKEPSEEKAQGGESVAVFLARVLREVLKICSPRKHPQLYQQTADALAFLDAITKSLSSPRKDIERVSLADDKVDFLCMPLQSACETKVIKLISLGVDGIKKLITDGEIRNSIKKAENGVHVIDRIVSTLYLCRDTQDEGIQLQLLRTVLSMILSKVLSVHGESLLRLLRICRHIFLHSRSTSNQKLAKSVFMQILHTVFSYLEQNPKEAILSSPRLPAHDLRLSPEVRTQEVSLSTEDIPDEADSHSTDRQLLVNIAEEEIHADGAVVALLRNDSAPSLTNRDKEDSHQQYRSLGSSSRSTEAEEHILLPELEIDDEVQFGSPFLNDSFIIFRSLCRQSVKKLMETSVLESVENRRKIFALEMLQMVLVNSGPVFRKHPLFLSAIRQYLCVSLIKNGVSHVPYVFGLSLSIFLALIAFFKEHLKVFRII